MGERQRDHSAGHREHARDRHGETHGEQPRDEHAGPGAERCLDVGDEAARGGLQSRELGHDEGEEEDGDARDDDRERRGYACGDRDHAEREVEIDPGPDVGDRRRGHLLQAELLLLTRRFSGRTHTSRFPLSASASARRPPARVSVCGCSSIWLHGSPPRATRSGTDASVQRVAVVRPSSSSSQ